MAGHQNPEAGNVLYLDDALRALATPPNPWNPEKAAYLVGRLAYLQSIARPGDLPVGIAEMSAYHWGCVYKDCRAELKEIRVEPRPQRWFLSHARRQAHARALAAQDRLRQRAYRAWIIRDLFREALQVSGNPQNVICGRFVLTSHTDDPAEGD